MGTVSGTIGLKLSRDFIARLAAIAKVDALPGIHFQTGEIQTAGRNLDLDGTLRELGLLTERKTLTPLGLTLIKPERAMIVVRDKPDTERQSIIFHSRAPLLLSDAVLPDGSHRIKAVTPSDMASFFGGWLSLDGIPAPDTIHTFSIQEAQLSEWIQNGLTNPQGQFLQSLNRGTRESLTESTRDRQWSASFLLLELTGNEAVDARSFYVWKSGNGIWTGELVNPPDLHRLTNDPITYHGLLAQMIRSLLHMEKRLRTYQLPDLELAYVFAALNRKDLVEQVCGRAGDSIPEGEWQKARDQLRTRGLVRITRQGYPTPSAELEQAVLPILLPARIGRIQSHSQSGGTGRGYLFLHGNGSFCVHFPSHPGHILECGTENQLIHYLPRLFPKFGSKNIKRIRPIRLPARTIQSLLMATHEQDVIALPDPTGLSKTRLAKLAADWAGPDYRASIQFKSGAGSGATEGLPLFLILKGTHADWFLTFDSGHGRGGWLHCPTLRDFPSLFQKGLQR